MGDVEEPQFTSLSARIASLNQQHVSQTPTTKRPPVPTRSKTVNNPIAPTFTNQANNLPNGDDKGPVLSSSASRKPPPPLPQRKSTQPSPALPPRRPSVEPSPVLPPRRPSVQPSPALPPRQTSTQLTRRESSESIASTISSMSTLSLTPSHASAGRGLKAPAYDPANLPPLPPTKREREQKAKEQAARAPLVQARSTSSLPQSRPTPSPRLPPRTNSTASQQSLAPPPTSQRQVKAPRPIQYLTSGTASQPQPQSVTPPPINLASKPSANQARPSYQAAAVPYNTPPPESSACLICRDFSGPDHVATLYPRQMSPTIDYLAQVLCGPFPSYTDKARAIFSWLHQNIAYDVVAFFGNNVKNVTPESIITHGAAVCGGYAGLFVAIATKAGLESVVIGGHGKGFGYSALKPGEPIPPEKAGHAWNAVRIDNGEWKLIDPCWGAGHLSGESQTYNKKFDASQFTMSNEDFGLKHFPSDHRSFFRADGSIVSWEDYYVGRSLGEPVQVFGRVNEDGLAEASFEPANKQISVCSNEVIRFQFTRRCLHWDFERNGSGKPYCMVLAINGLDGRKSDMIPFESNEFYYWLDIYPRDLGCAGQKVPIYAVTSINGVDGRGVTNAHFLSKKGNSGMGFAGIAEWILV